MPRAANFSFSAGIISFDPDDEQPVPPQQRTWALASFSIFYSSRFPVSIDAV
jgi:hypothetical protein